MGLFDFLRKNRQSEFKPILFDSIEDMVNSKFSPINFVYPGYPAVKQKYYTLPVCDLGYLVINTNNKYYKQINKGTYGINQKGEKVSVSDLIGGDDISIVSNSVPVLVQVTKESYYDASEFYTFYGFKQEVNNIESAYSYEKSTLLSSIHTLACISEEKEKASKEKRYTKEAIEEFRQNMAQRHDSFPYTDATDDQILYVWEWYYSCELYTYNKYTTIIESELIYNEETSRLNLLTKINNDLEDYGKWVQAAIDYNKDLYNNEFFAKIRENDPSTRDKSDYYILFAFYEGSLGNCSALNKIKNLCDMQFCALKSD